MSKVMARCKAGVTIQTKGRKSWGFEKLKECVDFKFIVKIKTPTQSLQECVCISLNFCLSDCQNIRVQNITISFIRLLLKLFFIY